VLIYCVNVDIRSVDSSLGKDKTSCFVYQSS